MFKLQGMYGVKYAQFEQILYTECRKYDIVMLTFFFAFKQQQLRPTKTKQAKCKAI